MSFHQQMYLEIILFFLANTFFSQPSFCHTLDWRHKSHTAFLQLPAFTSLSKSEHLCRFYSCPSIRSLADRLVICCTSFSQSSLNSMEKKLGISFRNRSLLEQALVHRSTVKNNLDSNQRLEFLGDAILGMVVADFLYRTYPQLREGDLTTIRKEVVNSQALAKVAKTVGLGDWILMTDLEEHTGGRTKESILADATESLIAAVYLDQGLESASELVIRWLGDMVKQVSPTLIILMNRGGER